MNKQSFDSGKLKLCVKQCEQSGGLKLDLSKCSIGDLEKKADLVAIQNAIQKFPNLQWLNLSDNALTNNAIAAIADTLKPLTNLTYLNLGGNAIGANALQALKDVLPRLTKLELYNTKFNGSGLEYFQDSLMQELNLSCNYLEVKGIGDFAQNISTLTNLQQLKLSSIKLNNDDYLNLLFAGLSNIHSLHTLTINNLYQNVTSLDICSLNNLLLQNPGVKEISLTLNEKFKNTGLYVINEMLEHHLDQNNFKEVTLIFNGLDRMSISNNKGRAALTLDNINLLDEGAILCLTASLLSCRGNKDIRFGCVGMNISGWGKDETTKIDCDRYSSGSTYYSGSIFEPTLIKMLSENGVKLHDNVRNIGILPYHGINLVGGMQSYAKNIIGDLSTNNMMLLGVNLPIPVSHDFKYYMNLSFRKMYAWVHKPTTFLDQNEKWLYTIKLLTYRNMEAYKIAAQIEALQKVCKSILQDKKAELENHLMVIEDGNQQSELVQNLSDLNNLLDQGSFGDICKTALGINTNPQEINYDLYA